MTRASEARFWQVKGGLAAGLGIVIMTYAYAQYGLAPLDRGAIQWLLLGSFLLVAGIAELIAGRALHMKETVLTRREAWLWSFLGTVCSLGGAAVLIIAWRMGAAVWLDRLSMGLAGAMSLLLGILCIVGERIMSHMQGMITAGVPERERVHAARA